MLPITRQALELFNRGSTEWFLDASRPDAVVLVNLRLGKIVFEWACCDLPRGGGARTIVREATVAIAAWEAATRPDALPDA